MSVNKTEVPNDAVRNRFERFKKMRKYSYSFDQLVEIFNSDKTFAEIAEALDVTKQNVSNLYKRHFRSSCEWENGRVRRRKLVDKVHQEEATTELTLTGNEMQKRISELASEAGCEVKGVARFGNTFYSRRSCEKKLLINGKVCRLHFIKNLHKTSQKTRRYYIHTNLSRRALRKTDFTIIFYRGAENELLFVIPNRFILKKFARRGKSNVQFYLPTERLPLYNNRTPKVDCWQFQNAWHLLKE